MNKGLGKSMKEIIESNSRTDHQFDLFKHSGDKLDRQFWVFHKENPHVYEALLDLTYRAKRKGYQHHGIKALVEILRWETGIKTSEEKGFKFCNSYTSRYARLIEHMNPDLKGFFRCRSLKTPSTLEEK